MNLKLTDFQLGWKLASPSSLPVSTCLHNKRLRNVQDCSWLVTWVWGLSSRRSSYTATTFTHQEILVFESVFRCVAQAGNELL